MRKPAFRERWTRRLEGVWLWSKRKRLDGFKGWVRGLGTRHRVRMEAELSCIKITRDGDKIDYGVVAKRLVTQSFVKRLAAQMAVDFSAADEWKFHGSGTDSTAESNSQSALITEVETRVTGSQVDTSAGTTGNYRSVGTQTYTASRTITEHGLFNAASAGTMLDRSTFSGIVVASGDSIEFTYNLTINPE